MHRIVTDPKKGQPIALPVNPFPTRLEPQNVVPTCNSRDNGTLSPCLDTTAKPQKHWMRSYVLTADLVGLEVQLL